MSANTTAANQSNFQQEVLQSDLPVIVDFWAPWCGPCKVLGPVLDDLAGQYKGKVKVVKVNVDENPELAQSYQVRGIPTVIAYQNSQKVKQMVGFGGPGPLKSLFDDLSASN